MGGSCVGKTTVSRRLAATLGVPHFELDALHHDAGWQEAPAEVLQARVRAALDAAPEGWVVDGNYGSKLGSLVLERADTVHLRSTDEVERWLQSIQATESMSGSSNGSERQKTPPFVET